MIKLVALAIPMVLPMARDSPSTGSATSLSDRFGGTVHVLGLPGAPVVLTSLRDDAVGAGRTLSGRPQTDTNGDFYSIAANAE